MQEQSVRVVTQASAPKIVMFAKRKTGGFRPAGLIFPFSTANKCRLTLPVDCPQDQRQGT